MPELSPGAVLRQLQQAQAIMKKARQALAQARGGSADPHHLLKIGWDALTRTHAILAAAPLSAANEDVMTKVLGVQRYATALLVRLRRIARNEPGALEGDDDLELGD
jgi:hypothetical protein